LDQEVQVDEIEQRVLDAAQRLFIHYGYDKTTVNDLSAESGVAKSTIYLRWKKKEEIFEALIWREGRVFIENWSRRIQEDPRGSVFSVFYRHALECLLENPFLLAVYKRDSRFLGSMIQRIGVTEFYLRRQEMVMQFFIALQNAGSIRQEVDAHTVSYLLNSIQYGLIQMGDIIPEANTPPLEEVLEMVVKMVDRLIASEDGGDCEAGRRILEDFMKQIQTTLNANLA